MATGKLTRENPLVVKNILGKGNMNITDCELLTRQFIATGILLGFSVFFHVVTIVCGCGICVGFVVSQFPRGVTLLDMLLFGCCRCFLSKRKIEWIKDARELERVMNEQLRVQERANLETARERLRNMQGAAPRQEEEEEEN